MKIRIIKREKVMLVLVSILILLVFVDFFLTLAGVKKLGIDSEGNPIVKKLLKEDKIMFWFLAKAIPSVFLFFFCFLMIWIGRRRDTKNIIYFFNTIFVIVIFIFIILNLGWVIILS